MQELTNKQKFLFLIFVFLLIILGILTWQKFLKSVFSENYNSSNLASPLAALNQLSDSQNNQNQEENEEEFESPESQEDLQNLIFLIGQADRQIEILKKQIEDQQDSKENNSSSGSGSSGGGSQNEDNSDNENTQEENDESEQELEIPEVSTFVDGGDNDPEEPEVPESDVFIDGGCAENLELDPPQITYPDDVNATTTNIVFGGTATPGTTIMNDFNDDVADCQFGEWNLEISSLPEGSVSISFMTTLGGIATSSPTTVDLEIELPPQIEEMDIVINEVAWAGTIANSADEWIELYNNTDEDVDLDNFILRTQDSGLELELNGIINSKSFYLIERTDDDTVSDIEADWTGPFSSGLNNSGEILELVFIGEESESIIDQTADCSGWCAGEASPNYISMERIDSNVSGTDTSNWQNNKETKRNGSDASLNPVAGTPREENS